MLRGSSLQLGPNEQLIAIMRRFSFAPLVMRSSGLVLVASAWWASTASSQTCQPADSRSRTIIQRLTDWITTPDPAKVQLRNTAYHIPVVPTSQLVVITDAQACRKASSAFAAELGIPQAPVYTIQMGSGASTWYAVHDPAFHAGKLGAVMIFDKPWKRYGEGQGLHLGLCSLASIRSRAGMTRPWRAAERTGVPRASRSEFNTQRGESSAARTRRAVT